MTQIYRSFGHKFFDEFEIDFPSEDLIGDYDLYNLDS